MGGHEASEPLDGLDRAAAGPRVHPAPLESRRTPTGHRPLLCIEALSGSCDLPVPAGRSFCSPRPSLLRKELGRWNRVETLVALDERLLGPDDLESISDPGSRRVVAVQRSPAARCRSTSSGSDAACCRHPAKRRPTNERAPKSIRSATADCTSRPWRSRSRRFEELGPEVGRNRWPPIGGDADIESPNCVVVRGQSRADSKSRAPTRKAGDPAPPSRFQPSVSARPL